MKYSRLSNRAGNILMVTLFTTAIIGVVLASCLTLIRSQNMSVMRSQAWNACIPMIEAGVEEAMAQLNDSAKPGMSSNGWFWDNGAYVQQRTLADNYYIVSITLSNASDAMIVCTGYVKTPVVVASANTVMLASAGFAPADLKQQFISRTVRVLARKQPLFVKAMVTRERIELNGNQINIDSFDSSDPDFSTLDGRYDPIKAKDNGDISTISGMKDSIGIGNANVKGRVNTGPGGSIAIGPNGIVGSTQWHNTQRRGIQPGWESHDMNVSFPDVETPSMSGALSPASKTVNGVFYKYYLTDGIYELSKLDMSGSDKMLVAGNATLLVSGNVGLSGKALVEIAETGSLKLYVQGPNATVAGVNNHGKAEHFIYYGLPSNKNIDLTANGEFTGTIYAPNANVKLSGGGSGVQNYVGACFARNVTMNGHFNVHYDEALGSFELPSKYVVVSWLEI